MFQRIFVSKRDGFRVESEHLKKELENAYRLKIEGLELINGYDIQNATQEQFSILTEQILTDPVTDMWSETLEEGDYTLAMEFLPGQFDQRADSAVQCLALIDDPGDVKIRSFRVLKIDGTLTQEEQEKIERHMINPIESRKKDLGVQKPMDEEMTVEPVEIVDGFIEFDRTQVHNYRKEMGFSMSLEDLLHIQKYFQEEEKRNPTMTELLVLDTYWSDHCRHTTFETILKDIQIEEGPYQEAIQKAFDDYVAARKEVGRDRPITFMDLGTFYGKYLRHHGKLEDLEVSPEINAASILIDVEVEGKMEPWLLQFKNETHNHPTEIEPFGGASTCVGGAIRDPLSGRAYVYQAMRITGAADVTAPVEDTIAGKLPQSKISKTAAKGYSSYGNQIGLAATYVEELFHPGYIAKRMEIGAVIGASPRSHVKREEPAPGDVIFLLGGATGRDGVGGATGSSKEHTESSLEKSSSEVQKGNAPEERKLQRLMRRKDAAELIKRSNDFGAGGVSVAIGEIAEGVHVNLDAVPLKYHGLDGTEVAISESQERMAVVLDPKDVDTMMALCKEENVSATHVADVTEEKRMVMHFKGQKVVDLSRAFLDTSGVQQEQVARIVQEPPLEWPTVSGNTKEEILGRLEELSNSSQQGMVEMFDSTIGRSTVLLPYGGKYQKTRSQASVQTLPVEGGTDTASVLTYGYDPYQTSYEPFVGTQYAVIESLARQVAVGSDYKTARLTVQEYFERLGEDETRWGKVLKALLGLWIAQRAFETPAIGGKDSMSGTFEEYDVPPTLVSFAVTLSKASKTISQELKEEGHKLVLVPHTTDDKYLPNYDWLKKNWDRVLALQEEGKVYASAIVKGEDWTTTLIGMALGNRIGFTVDPSLVKEAARVGSLLLEVSQDADISDWIVLGETQKGPMAFGEAVIDFCEAQSALEKTLGELYPILEESKERKFCDHRTHTGKRKAGLSISKPKVLLPVFPGTNCEFDTADAFRKEGAFTEAFVLQTQNREQIEESMEALARKIKESQILTFSGGFSGGDEPDGSGKFIVSVLKNSRVREAIEEFLVNDGLILGICNGFQALIKSGLIPTGTVSHTTPESPTLFVNENGRHISRMVYTTVVSTLSPWMQGFKPGDTFVLPISHGEGRIIAPKAVVEELYTNGQVASVYSDADGNPGQDAWTNPNGSYCAIEAITSPDGKVLGRMAHGERYKKDLFRNIPGEKEMNLFKNGVEYFK